MKFSLVASLLFLSYGLFAQSRVSISGYVTDAETGESLIGAYVSIGTSGAITNSYGFYSCPIERGNATISYSYIGYKTVEKTISATVDTLVNVSLTASEFISEAVVTASDNSGIRSAYLGTLDLPVSRISNDPVVLGEPDVLKVLQKTPGVQTGMEGLSGFYVRGGGAEENLLLYDGVPLYNVSHLLGLLSVYTPDAVKKVTFFKGSFPAKYGGRISSIVDVRANDGNMEKVSGSVSVGLISEKFHIEGPLATGKTTYSVTFRAMPTAILDKLLVPLLDKDYYFYDINSKLVHRIGLSDKIYLSLYHGKDKYTNNKETKRTGYYVYSESYDYYTYPIKEKHGMQYGWGNTMASLRWNHVFSPKLFSGFSVSWSRYHSKRKNSNGLSGYVKEVEYKYSINTVNTSISGINDLNLGLDFEYTPNHWNLIDFGLQATRHSFTPESDYIATMAKGDIGYPDDKDLNGGFKNRLDGGEASIYFEDNISIGKNLTIDAGIRTTLFRTQGKTYTSIEPRLSSQFVIKESLSVKLGYSKMSQYVHMLSSGMMTLPTDLWLPITCDVKPVTSDIVSAGLYHKINDNYSMSIEGYWKRSHNVLDYKDGKATLTTSVDWAETVSQGEGKSKGLEFTAEKAAGKTRGWLSYTLSKSTRWYPDGSINGGKEFPYTYDRRHNFNITVIHNFSKSIDINASWTYYSGNMITSPMRAGRIFDFYGGVDVPYVTSRNNYRIPSTHHLDLSVSVKKQKRKGLRTWRFGVYNAYGWKNPNVIDQYLSFYVENNEFKSKMKVMKVSFLTFVPSVSYTYDF